MFMYFWLNCCDKNHYVERISIAVKNIDHLFHLTSEMIDADRLHLFLLFDSSRIDENEYLSSLENSAELIVCKKEPIQKLLIYFELKRCLASKTSLAHDILIIFYDEPGDYYFQITLMCSFIEAVITSASLVQSVFHSLYV